MSAGPSAGWAAPEEVQEGLAWPSHSRLAAVDGAVVGNTVGFTLGAFPGMCIGAAAGGVAGVLGGGLLVPVLHPAIKAAGKLEPGKLVLPANGTAGNMIGKMCLGPRAGLGKNPDGVEDASVAKAEGTGAGCSDADSTHASNEAEEREGEGVPRALGFASWAACKEAIDAAMVRASVAGAQGATSGAEVGGAVVGTALAVPCAAVGSVIGGMVGMCSDIREHFSKRDGGVGLAEEAADGKEAAEGAACLPGKPVFKG